MKKFVAEIGSIDSEVSLTTATKIVLIEARDVYGAHKHAYMQECNPGQEVLSIKAAGTETVLYTLKEGFKKS
jgi:predicted secreted protein